MSEKHKYCTDCCLQAHAIKNFNAVRHEIEEMHGCKIKVIKMSRCFEYYAIYELVKGE